MDSEPSEMNTGKDETCEHSPVENASVVDKLKEDLSVQESKVKTLEGQISQQTESLALSRVLEGKSTQYTLWVQKRRTTHIS